jgi:hypothetical protein
LTQRRAVECIQSDCGEGRYGPIAERPRQAGCIPELAPDRAEIRTIFSTGREGGKRSNFYPASSIYNHNQG